MSETVQAVAGVSFESEMLGKPGVALVDFWAPWCGPCRIMSPVVEDLAKTLRHEARVYSVNIDEAPQAAGRLEIHSIPTLVVFRDGQEIGRLVGARPKDQVLAWFRLLVGTAKTAASSTT